MITWCAYALVLASPKLHTTSDLQKIEALWLGRHGKQYMVVSKWYHVCLPSPPAHNASTFASQT